MRSDSDGMFWQDLAAPPKPTIKKEVIKREPPEPFWLEPDYLPYLEQANDFAKLPVDQLWDTNEKLVVDVEVYPNYFLVAFKGVNSGRVGYVESYNESELNTRMLAWLMEHKETVGFNSRYYDLPMVMLALNGASNAMLQHATDLIIKEGQFAWDVLKELKCRVQLNANHIDLKEVAPLFASLKIYGGRMHLTRMQDLPFAPGTYLTPQQRDIVRLYCINDLDTTIALYSTVGKEIALREQMSLQYNVDLRSKSDAQIAEAVIKASWGGKLPEPPGVQPGKLYFYKAPAFMQFLTPQLQHALTTVQSNPFVTNEHGKMGLPADIKKLDINIGGVGYQMGIGGLHSNEKGVQYHTTNDCTVVDRDVASYYPMIVLNQKLYPKHLGPKFLSIYGSLVERRLAAKASGDKATADTLKITINGTFGKTGNAYSILYSPELVVQITLTGQLCLLMLIEALDSVGIAVVSANTDGVVMVVPSQLQQKYNQVVRWWEQVTQFETEETQYQNYYGRDVNNYIAIKPDGSVKTKGTFSSGGLSKNPANTIINDALVAFLRDGVPVDHTVRSCTDIRKFLAVRTVKGGAVCGDQYLGGAIRWYHSTASTAPIVYAKSGNLVPQSDSSVPCLNLPTALPSDIDYDWYINEVEKNLQKFT